MNVEKLIGEFSAFSSAHFNGWLIARAVYKNVPSEKTGIIKNNSLFSKITVSDENSTLSIILVPPRKSENSKTDDENCGVLNEDNICGNFRFSRKDILDFVQKNGDINPIHKEKRAVVPGLMILGYLCKNSDIVSMEIEFKNRIYSDDMVYLVREHSNEADVCKCVNVDGIVENKCCFTAKIISF